MVGRKLGRGLQFLLSDRGRTEPPAPEDAPGIQPPNAAPAASNATSLPIDSLQANPFQPRTRMPDAEIEELAASIRQSGILQPILVRRSGSQWQVIAGERRLRAAKRAGLTEVPVFVKDVDDVAMRLLALVENLQRQDLGPVEKAQSFHDLKRTTGWTHERIAAEIGLDRSSVTNYLRLLELEPGIRRDLESGALTMGHARALLTAPPLRRAALAKAVVDQGLSVRETERLAATPEARDTTARPPKRGGKPAWALEMESHLMAALGCRVAVQQRVGKGRIVLEVGSRAEFDRIYELLMDTMPIDREQDLVQRKLDTAPSGDDEA
jgi:ParB family chromosome partitioning protein